MLGQHRALPIKLVQSHHETSRPTDLDAACELVSTAIASEDSEVKALVLTPVQKTRNARGKKSRIASLSHRLHSGHVPGQ
jgi:hypothetical protein